MKRIILAVILILGLVSVGYCKTDYMYKVLRETKFKNGNSKLFVEYSDSTGQKRIVIVLMKSKDVGNDDSIINAVDTQIDKQDSNKKVKLVSRVIIATDN